MLVGPSQHGRGHGRASPDANPGQIRGRPAGGLGPEGLLDGDAEAVPEAGPQRVGGHRVVQELAQPRLSPRLAAFSSESDRDLSQGGVGQRREELDPAVPR